MQEPRQGYIKGIYLSGIDNSAVKKMHKQYGGSQSAFISLSMIKLITRVVYCLMEKVSLRDASDVSTSAILKEYALHRKNAGNIDKKAISSRVTLEIYES